MKGSREGKALRSWLSLPVVLPIVAWCASKAVQEVLYAEMMRQGKPFRAFLLRPFYFLRRAL